MDSLEVFAVESAIPSEQEFYRKIIEDNMASLRLAPAIGRIKVVLRPEDSLFQMAIILRDVGTRVTTIDIADVEAKPVAGEIIISIKKEQYIPELLRKLWERYGRANISQPDRWTVAISTDRAEEEASFLKDMVVADPRHRLHENLVDFAIRITPEGFRVRYHLYKGNKFIFVASEEALKHEWIEETETMLEKLMEGGKT
ncbi:MAG: methanogenesis marker 17 protein [Methanosarcina thermophila]|jgi:putative methanogenesis marker protein 17|uniref:Putative methanogenesis marker protein 17 n=3 Tax=Methanosarcina thermophila TaxID=2210 RepID=A0A1I6X7K1_METTE|nr:methanogenesis marker 17 protein [Methanosarcina thermophila]ALK04616.1 MAG: methanogenesis marker protein 17 [Methanosarcina sp. 795]AKB13285.1 putative methanogenesis marker protein 17 [Methanosarcina thermophila TM-1]AKB16080.1 putative methanogenesis marker protein 17 [Methanosarcina thermophila CHTI-55]NLU57243.1 methanogenesis marker 17 protein [Methanosarcina thermophila]SFT34280.1 putative methanogenesis marker protein 17 [Methanosarcina thermophila]